MTDQLKGLSGEERNVKTKSMAYDFVQMSLFLIIINHGCGSGGDDIEAIIEYLQNTCNINHLLRSRSLGGYEDWNLDLFLDSMAWDDMGGLTGVCSLAKEQLVRMVAIIDDFDVDDGQSYDWVGKGRVAISGVHTTMHAVAHTNACTPPFSTGHHVLCSTPHPFPPPQSPRTPRAKKQRDDDDEGTADRPRQRSKPMGGGIGDADTRNTGDKESYERQMKFISDTYLSMFASPQEVITAMLFSDTHEKLAGKPGGKLFAAYVVNLTLEEDPPQFVSHSAIAFIDHLLQGGKTKVWPLTSLSMSPVSPMCCPYLTHLYITLCFTILR